jgi:hypothetical protein
MTRHVCAAIVILALAALACGQYIPTVTPTAAPSATPTPTATPVPTATVTPFPAAEDGQTAVVRVASVNVRQSPCDKNGENCGTVLGQVFDGQSVTVLGYSDDGEWAQIETAEISGWIFSGCLQGSEKGCVAK